VGRLCRQHLVRRRRHGPRRLVGRFLADAGGAIVWDLGANTGRFSRIAAGLGRDVVSWDIDPAAVERNYRQVRRDGDERVLPLVLDLANPSPGLGWANEERRSVPERANADVVLALALVHHLAIGRNVPLDRIASFFARLAPQLVIEFVPKDDPMVRTLLATREDVFDDYTMDGWRHSPAPGGRRRGAGSSTPRTLFRMARRR
jgi:ribosomal protein L11 methylase PrmA